MIANVKKSKKEIALEVKKRIDHVVKLLNENNKISKQDIRTSTMNKFKVTEKQVDVYIVEAKKLIKPNDKKKKKNKPELTEKQKQFCIEYMKDFNGTKAAIRSGYSKKTAKEIASQNLTKLNVQKYMKTLLSKVNKKHELTIDKVLTDINTIKEACIKAGKKFDARAVLKACELEGKYLKMFTEKLEISGDKENPIMFKLDYSNLTPDELRMLKEFKNFLKEKCVKNE